ncbi:MAG: hypothetical protein H0S85_00515 [Desulfovibrionaceae bacterium]|jgi:hypothetical protein|nr:hypothetical protein [Desulfovibrionaceae bacterium]
MDFHVLAGLRRYLSVKHHLPGRIRIKFDAAITRDPEALRLAQSNGELPPAVLGVRRNMLARSVVIEYDSEIIDPELLEELATTQDDARAAELAARLYAAVGGTR